MKMRFFDKFLKKPIPYYYYWWYQFKNRDILTKKMMIIDNYVSVKKMIPLASRYTWWKGRVFCFTWSLYTINQKEIQEPSFTGYL